MGNACESKKHPSSLKEEFKSGENPCDTLYEMFKEPISYIMKNLGTVYSPKYACTVEIKGKQYKKAVAPTKYMAKLKAAKATLLSMKQEKSVDPSNPPANII